MSPTDLEMVHDFWFGPLPEFNSFNADRLSLWFGGARDSEISERFLFALDALDAAEDPSIDVAVLSLSQQVGLVVLLDQFPRSIFRGQPRSYAYDEAALAAVRIATAGGMQKFKLIERSFLTICLNHSEQLEDQERALKHYVDDILPYAPAGNRFYEAGGIQTAKYLDVIQRFGRFPHRNEILGRVTTAQEATFLAQSTMAPFS